MDHLTRETLLGLFEDLATAGREIQGRHLLVCEPCRARAGRVLSGGEYPDETWEPLPAKANARGAQSAESAAPPVSPAPLPEPVGGRLARKALKAVEMRLHAHAADRRRAAGLQAELLALAPAERLPSIGADCRFHSPGLANRLLDRAEELGAETPAEAEHLAALALAIARSLPPRWSNVERETLFGRSRCLEGEVLRLRGDLAGAEVALWQARGHFEVLPVGNPERAEYCRLLARLRREQERDDEALALMARAIERYDNLPDLRRAAECRMELAWMLLEEMELEGALPLFERVLAEGEIAEADFGRWLSLRHGLALAYAERQRHGAARAVLADVAAGAAKRPHPDQLRAMLVAASVAQRLGANDEAATLLAVAWEGLGEEGEPYEALRALVELAELMAELGRLAEIERLSERLSAVDCLPAPVLEALRFGLQFAAVHGLAASEMLEALQLYLRRARHDPEARFSILLVRGNALRWDEAEAELRKKLAVLAGLGEEAAGIGAEIGAAGRQRLAWTAETVLGLRLVFADSVTWEAGEEAVH